MCHMLVGNVLFNLASDEAKSSEFLNSSPATECSSPRSQQPLEWHGAEKTGLWWIRRNPWPENTIHPLLFIVSQLALHLTWRHLKYKDNYLSPWRASCKTPWNIQRKTHIGELFFRRELPCCTNDDTSNTERSQLEPGIRKNLDFMPWYSWLDECVQREFRFSTS